MPATRYRPQAPPHRRTWRRELHTLTAAHGPAVSEASIVGHQSPAGTTSCVQILHPHMDWATPEEDLAGSHVGATRTRREREEWGLWEGEERGGPATTFLATCLASYEQLQWRWRQGEGGDGWGSHPSCLVWTILGRIVTY
ncbi:hypothetical protein SEVIR_3G320200v4 [Setaria viridis]|uniref:Uncharacterized protein n=1 Tax=Setaria viridis TaxID=4556 RepID=A0A4U6VIC7_SETVI|nr:hypothetical protein SEVIR_3G320200v2 [Setaria viridis]